jgi:hypothetical protein
MEALNTILNVDPNSVIIVLLAVFFYPGTGFGNSFFVQTQGAAPFSESAFSNHADRAEPVVLCRFGILY